MRSQGASAGESVMWRPYFAWRRLLCWFLKHRRSLNNRFRANHLDDWTYVFACTRCGDEQVFTVSTGSALESLFK